MKLQNFPKKSLGQNFLIDKNIIKKIIRIGDLNHKNTVIEIGPGTGNLTEEIILTKPKKIIIIEKDKNLSLLLEKKYANSKNLNVINSDILDFINDKIQDMNVTVFGNLPYNISTRVLAKLILLDRWPPWYDKLVLMFQKEVADRIIAKSKTENFSRISVLSNWRLEVKKHFDISRNCFFPKPKVTSTLLSFKPKKSYKFNIKNPKNLEVVTRVLFSNPRKMINKNLLKLFKKNNLIIKKLNMNQNLRPKELECEEIYKIASKYDDLFE